MSLTSDDLADIKQLMEAVVSAALKEQDERFDGIDQQFARIDQQFARIDQRFDDQDEKLDEIMNAVGMDLAKHSAKIDDHETRIKRLERKAA